MPKVFSPRTLAVFEDAAASVPLRLLDRAFEGAGIALGVDDGAAGGARRAQFRRYVASVDQRDSQQLDRLGDALGALIAEVAPSKVDFLVQAAERDGFLFTDGFFRPAATAATSFAVTRVDDLGSIDDRRRRLHLLANESPQDAVGGALELVESVCLTILNLVGDKAPANGANLVEIADATLAGLELVQASIDANESDDVVGRCLQQLVAVVARLGEVPNASASGGHARLMVGAAAAFAGFVAETYAEQAARSSRNLARNGH